MSKPRKAKPTPKPNTRPGGSVGGPSGMHAGFRRQLTADAEAWEAMDLAASKAGVSWAVWARDILLATAAK